MLPEDSTFDKGGSTIIIENENIYKYSLGLLNSKVYKDLVTLLNPTLNFQVKDIRSLPLQLEQLSVISHIVDININDSKTDWDSFETSWEFKKHPLI